jgi:class 3 adenylate cyclase
MNLSIAEPAYARFVPPGTATLIEAGGVNGLEKVEKPVAVLFVDIVGCARLCEELPPLTMNALIESYFEQFFDVVQDREGTVNEIMGDGFMVVFESGTLHVNAEHAVSAASEILSVTARTRAARENDTQVHIGLHAGTALVGVTRFRSRLGERWTYTASGPVSNIAARLCQLAEPGAVFVSSKVVDLVGGRFSFQDMGTATLKNIRHPVAVHRLVT